MGPQKIPLLNDDVYLHSVQSRSRKYREFNVAPYLFHLNKNCLLTRRWLIDGPEAGIINNLNDAISATYVINDTWALIRVNPSSIGYIIFFLGDARKSLATCNAATRRRTCCQRESLVVCIYVYRYIHCRKTRTKKIFQVFYFPVFEIAIMFTFDLVLDYFFQALNLQYACF